MLISPSDRALELLTPDDTNWQKILYLPPSLPPSPPRHDGEIVSPRNYQTLVTTGPSGRHLGLWSGQRKGLSPVSLASLLPPERGDHKEARGRDMTLNGLSYVLLAAIILCMSSPAP